MNSTALTLDENGLVYYGKYSILLREDLIAHRASVFEENPFFFTRRHAVIAGTDPPPGHRATWDQRGLLAMAKLYPKITPGMGISDFPTVLMEPRRDKEDCDFIEVHIFGPIHVLAIESVVGPKPATSADRLLWK